MNRKIWLIVFLLGSLILLLGGMHRPEQPLADANAADPVVRNAESAVSQAAGSADAWKKAADDNPTWLLQIEAVEEE